MSLKDGIILFLSIFLVGALLFTAGIYILYLLIMFLGLERYSSIIYMVYIVGFTVSFVAMLLLTVTIKLIEEAE